MVYDVFAAVFRGLFVWGIHAENMREYAFKDVSDTPLRTLAVLACVCFLRAVCFSFSFSFFVRLPVSTNGV